MKEDLKKIERLYDSVAREYAETFSGDHEKKPKDREVLNRFAREIGKKGPVWDLGCGPGQTTQYLMNLGVDISGMDLSEKLLDQARSLHPDARFRKGNILDLDFEDESIAGIVAFYAIVHFTAEQVEKLFREVFRVLFPGGALLVACHIGEDVIHVSEFLGKKVCIDVMLFSTEFISGCLRKIGFNEIETIERDPYPDFEYASRRAYIFAKKPDPSKQLER